MSTEEEEYRQKYKRLKKLYKEIAEVNEFFFNNIYLMSLVQDNTNLSARILSTRDNIVKLRERRR